MCWRGICLASSHYFRATLEIIAWDVGSLAAGGSIRTEIGHVRGHDSLSSFLFVYEERKISSYTDSYNSYNMNSIHIIDYPRSFLEETKLFAICFQ